jgi:hypothetical protein
MHADIPQADNRGGSHNDGDDAVDQMLRGLPVATLPAAWRGIILQALPLPPPQPPSPSPVSPASSGTPFFTLKFVSLLAGIWGLTAFLHFTTPEPPPRREGDPLPVFPPARTSSPFAPSGEEWDPWLAQNQTLPTQTDSTP